MNTQIQVPAQQVVEEAPHLAHYTMVPTSPAIDQGDRYDPVWAKCVELGVAPTCHNSSRGRGTLHNSPSNYVFNSLNSFGKGSEYFCRSLFLGACRTVFRNSALLFWRAGPGGPRSSITACSSIGKTEPQGAGGNPRPHQARRGPAGGEVREVRQRLSTPERIRADPDHPLSTRLKVPPEEMDDFAPTGVNKPEDIRDIFARNFYFGARPTTA